MLQRCAFLILLAIATAGAQACGTKGLLQTA